MKYPATIKCFLDDWNSYRHRSVHPPTIAGASSLVQPPSTVSPKHLPKIVLQQDGLWLRNPPTMTPVFPCYPGTVPRSITTAASWPSPTTTVPVVERLTLSHGWGTGKAGSKGPVLGLIFGQFSVNYIPLLSLIYVANLVFPACYGDSLKHESI